MINSILLTDFTGFANTRFDFTKGINVLIGKNGTGKTHVLKCLAATLQARHDFLGKNSTSKEQFEYILAEDMIFYFKPDVIGNLVNKGVPSGRANITVTIDGKLLQYSFSSASKTTVKLETDEKWDDRHFIYIPPREMFSLFEGFIGLSSKREISFDQTYINLAHALSLPILRESEDNPLKPAIKLLEQELQFKVLQMNGRFYIQTEKGNMEAHLVAEGLRQAGFHLVPHTEWGNQCGHHPVLGRTRSQPESGSCESRGKVYPCASGMRLADFRRHSRLPAYTHAFSLFRI